MRIQKPRGFRDWHDLYIFGNSKDMPDLNNFKYSLRRSICGFIEEVFIAWGYSGIETPIMEEFYVFESNDEALLRANKEFFLLEKKSEDEQKYVLRPENTASVARVISEEKILQNNPMVIPVYYWGPFFRYERPQAGRFRQFTQMGIERINASSVRDDIENILVVEHLKEKWKIPSELLKLKINFFSSKEVLEKWNTALTEYFLKFEDQLSENSRKRIYKNPYRILDDKEDSHKDFIKHAPLIDDFFNSLDKFKKKEFEDVLREHRVQFEWCPTLVRGIDYYTGLIYEWQYKNGLSIAAGGRYDDLFLRFGSETYPSSGLAIGVERFMMVLDDIGALEIHVESAFKKYRFFYFFNRSLLGWPEIKCVLRSMKFMSREHMSRVFTEYGNFDVNEHFKRAKRMGALWVLYLDEEQNLNISNVSRTKFWNIEKHTWKSWANSCDLSDKFWRNVYQSIDDHLSK